MEKVFNHINNVDAVKTAIKNSGFDICHESIRPCKHPNLQYFDDLGLSQQSVDFWKERGYSQMWSHQKLAIEKAKEGNNICISTSTSSGKTEIFQTIAIETLVKRKGAKVLAVYSAKALNRQQERRWQSTGFSIGKIDGDDRDLDERMNTLRNCDIVVMTPDVIHAFLLANVNNRTKGKAIQKFIKNVDLIIIDEIHLYRGVFGSNSAYLFRRFNNLRRIYRDDLSFPLYVTASATLPNPAEHSAMITGANNFENIGIEKDGSPTAETMFIYIDKQKQIEDPLTHKIAQLVSNLTTIEGAKSITFTNGRQQTGAYVMDGRDILDQLNLEEKRIYAFRAGVEPEAREKILHAMENKEFNGIVSTSALEIGIDVSGLNICILANIPYNLNSYYQRIGRVGRGGTDCKSYVIIVNDQSVSAKILFENQYDITKVLPDLEPALHLDNKRVIHLHAAMHVDTRSTSEVSSRRQITEGLRNYFPQSFCDFSELLQYGQEPDEYKNLVENLPTPQFISIRNMGESYRIIEGDAEKETVTKKQLYNEAYKGAIRNASNSNDVWYFQRVERIDQGQRRIFVRQENNQNRARSTKPNRRTGLYPALTKKSIEKIFAYDETLILNTGLREVQTIHGYTEYYYNNKSYHSYDRPYRDSQYTTGILIFNPSLNEPGVMLNQIAEIFYYAFLMQKQFESTDIEKGSATLSYSSPVRDLDINAHDKFIAIYDANKLNITSALMNKEVIVKTFSVLKKNIKHFSETLLTEPMNAATKKAILTICEDICNHPIEEAEIDDVPNTMRVFALGSLASLEMVNEETGESEFVPCHIAGVNKVVSPKDVEPLKDVVDYSVICSEDREFLQHVEMENLHPVENSIFGKYDWEHGCFITR